VSSTDIPERLFETDHALGTASRGDTRLMTFRSNVADIELMRIIPDSAPEYPDIVVTVKPYLLDSVTLLLG
jgi:hypothetical protein